ncbi:hypothetical protein GW17_00041685 [Ensete ventricosum]|nr:hypothetical protein GW17_00041685 [Ensete ventricosum]
MASRLLWASRAASYLRISAFHRGLSTGESLIYGDDSISSLMFSWPICAEIFLCMVSVGDLCFPGVLVGRSVLSDVLFVISFQDHLGDVVYVELPEVGVTVAQGKNFGAVESVKATSDVNSPVSGEVVEVNSELVGSPGLVSFGQHVNGSPYENGWIIKVKMSDTGELNSLMDSNQYSKFCEEEDAKH